MWGGGAWAQAPKHAKWRRERPGKPEIRGRRERDGSTQLSCMTLRASGKSPTTCATMPAAPSARRGPKLAGQRGGAPGAGGFLWLGVPRGPGLARPGGEGVNQALRRPHCPEPEFVCACGVEGGPGAAPRRTARRWCLRDGHAPTAHRDRGAKVAQAAPAPLINGTLAAP
jgi:hypothetical protein